MVWLTICIEPPPTSFLNLTSEKSGSMPVVSQSIMKPMVPVGASTEAWALRKPFRLPRSTTLAHSWVASLCTWASAIESVRTVSLAAWCLRITRWCASALRAYPAYGPTTEASSAERRYEVPVISEVIAAAIPRPPSLS